MIHETFDKFENRTKVYKYCRLNIINNLDSEVYTFFHVQVESGIDVTEVQSLKDLSAGEHVTSFTVEDLYLFMGRELDALDEIPAGNVLGNFLHSLTIKEILTVLLFNGSCSFSFHLPFSRYWRT